MNRRAFVRFSVEFDVRYRILESLQPHEESVTEDMCERGMKIRLPERVEPETRLELTVHIPGDKMPLVAIGRVAWIKKDILSQYYTAGIHLVHIKAEDRERFYKYALL